jgi:hypothetical protein
VLNPKGDDNIPQRVTASASFGPEAVASPDVVFGFDESNCEAFGTGPNSASGGVSLIAIDSGELELAKRRPCHQHSCSTAMVAKQSYD